MICLGIESTAHTFGVGVLERNGSTKILSDVKDVYKAKMGSGIHPREASRHHAETCGYVLGKALQQAGITIKDIDFVSYSAGPGLGPCLRVGAVVSRAISSYYAKPLVPTNHAIGHIELGKILCGIKDPLVLVVSGGHTALAAKLGEDWRIFGETLDLTLGQLIDQLGRFLGMSSPAGPEIERLALDGSKEESTKSILTRLPYTIKGNDVSYSGLLSASKDLFTEGASRESICYAVQELAFSILAEATERALAFTDKKELLVTGGVAANQRLASLLELMCRKRGIKIGVIPRQFAGDCGSQIAAAGFAFYDHGDIVSPANAYVRQSWRLDQVRL
ncbi:MAG: KEOPS complex N(6)-L-threonylcarbamoyladenine synthase Kae1 [Nitrososphaerales archaeon]